MIFRHQSISNTLEWTDSVHLCELVIENPDFLRKVFKELGREGEERELGFSHDGRSLSFEKEVDVIFNPLQLNFNNRRAVAALLKELVRMSMSESFYLETNELKTKIIKYLVNLVDNEDFCFEVITEDFNVEDLAKAASLHIIGDEHDFVELLTNYMSMMSELVAIKVFVFINLRSLLESSELRRLLHNLDNHQINVLLIENHDLGKFEQVPRIIIDSDQCEL